MSRKILVPEGMLDAACDENEAIGVHNVKIEKMLAAGLRWLSENPITPTREQVQALFAAPEGMGKLGYEFVEWAICEWQRRMCLAPEPEVPEEVKDLLANPWGFDGTYDSNIIEAFRRGQKSK